MFDALPLAALLNNKVFLCHGGISPYLHRPQDVNSIVRPLVSEAQQPASQPGAYLASTLLCLGRPSII